MDCIKYRIANFIIKSVTQCNLQFSLVVAEAILIAKKLALLVCVGGG